MDTHLSRLRVRDLRLWDRQVRDLLKDLLRDLLTDLERDDLELIEDDLERLLDGLEYERLEERDARLHHKEIVIKVSFPHQWLHQLPPMLPHEL